MTTKTQQKIHIKNVDSCVTCFNSLGITSRMKIYKYLKLKGKSTVTAIVEFVGLTQPTISYHLNEMRTSGVLNSERVGKEVYYSINEKCHNYDRDCVLKDVEFPE